MALRLSIEKFQESIQQGEIPGGLSESLQALWYEAKGQVDKANRLVKSDGGTQSLRVQAYLARKRGAEVEALEYYTQAGCDPCRLSCEKEWETLVMSFLRGISIS